MQTEHQLAVTKILSEVIIETALYPNIMRITEKRGSNGVVIEVYPHTADYPILVGKGGRQINAYRKICEIAGKYLKQEISFNVLETFIGQREAPRDTPFNPRFDVEIPKSRIVGLLAATAAPIDSKDIIVDQSHDRLNFGIPIAANDYETQVLIRAINDIMWPWAKRHGVKIWLNPSTTHGLHCP